MKIRPVGVELLHAGGRTDMTKLIVTFANAPKNYTVWYTSRQLNEIFVVNVLPNLNTAYT
jgi:hypothetical protein